MTGQEEVHLRRGLALFDEVGAGWKPFEMDESGRIAETRPPGGTVLLAGHIKVRRPDLRHGRPGCRVRGPWLAGPTLGKRSNTDLGAGTRVRGERAASAKGLVIGMGEDAQQTQRPATG